MTDLFEAVKTTLDYCRQNNIRLPEDITRDARQLGLIPSARKAADYSSIRDRLYLAIFDAVDGFLSSNAHAGTYSRVMAVAVSQAYLETAEIAYVEGGGSLPLDDDTAAWVRGELDAQLGFVDSLFETLKALRKEGDFEAENEAVRRADGYCNSLDAFFNGVKLSGAGNIMLTFDGDDGKESCTDCQRYKGQRHRASWWIAHDAVPPSRSFECGGYHCDHFLRDDDGNEFTI